MRTTRESRRAIVPGQRPPGPPELYSGPPNAVIDLQTSEGVQLVKGTWRYCDAKVQEVQFVDVGPDLGPGTTPNHTYDVVPHAQGTSFDDSDWQILAPSDTQRRLGTGRVCFSWYRINVTIPPRVGDFDPMGSTVVFEVVVDDYAEVWVNGELPLILGQMGGQVAAGFNAPNRVVLTRDARPGQRFQIAIFGMNGPISMSPTNYIWLRTATLDFYAHDATSMAWGAELGVVPLDERLQFLVPASVRLERVAAGFESTDGPVWMPHGGLLFSSPRTNTVYRWDPIGTVTVFRPKSGYTGVDIGEFPEPGARGLAFDPQGRLTICQQGNRRVIRVEPHGNITVLADRYQGKRLNSPSSLAYRSDGTLYFTDPPFGLPQSFGDARRELPFSGVYAVQDGRLILADDSLAAPFGIAVSPDGRHLYVGNHDQRRVVLRYALDSSGSRLGNATVFCDLTDDARPGAIRGLEADPAGNLYICSPEGIWLVSPEGHRLGILELPEPATDLAWGDVDDRTLYITTLTSIYRSRLLSTAVDPTAIRRE